MNTTIILGAACTGKSRLVRILTRNEKVTVLHPDFIRSKSSLNSLLVTGLHKLQAHITALIIDDVRKKDLKNVVRLIVAEYIKIEKQGEDPIIIEPHLYIISNELELEHLNASILARSTVYTCTENLEHEINRTIHHPEGIDQVFNAR